MTAPTLTPEQKVARYDPAVAEQQALSRAEQKTALAKIKAYARMDDVQERFIALLGQRDGRAYVESVIIAVAGNEGLQKCTPKSIMISAMRAASLHLSVDPVMKQAHLVPFKSEAVLIVDYHGLVSLSEETGWYDIAPNVFEVYEGETVKLDRFSGKVTIEGARTGKAVIGWCGYFKSKVGTERYLYMTNEECDEHGKKYSRAFESARSGWQTDREKMRRKTVLRLLVSRWGHFSPHVETVLKQDEIVEGDAVDMPSDENIEVIETEPQRTEEQNIAELMGEGAARFPYNDTAIINRLARAKKVKPDEMAAILAEMRAHGEIPEKVTLKQVDDLAARLNI